jgi:hypothetical protein
VGHAHRVTSRAADGGQVFYEDMVMALVMLDTPQTLRTALMSETDGQYALRRFRFTLASPAAVFTATGATDGQRLAVTYGPEGHTTDLAVPPRKAKNRHRSEIEALNEAAARQRS